jgi:hypothetical protein
MQLLTEQHIMCDIEYNYENIIISTMHQEILL